MNFAGLVTYGKHGSEYTGGISTSYAAVNNSWLVMWHDDILRVLNTREEAEHYATQLTTEGIVPLHPHREEKDRRRREKQMQEQARTPVPPEAPVFVEPPRRRESEAKRDRLKHGRQRFKVGDSVMHEGSDDPRVGLILGAKYREYEADGTGWYYLVSWWDPARRQPQESSLHQDYLRPL